jgi:hypothetical protein
MLTHLQVSEFEQQGLIRLPQTVPTATDGDQLRRYLDDGAVVEGTHIRVAELCGQPGDVVLMNQRVLHVTAPNALAKPRMMLSDFIT